MKNQDTNDLKEYFEKHIEEIKDYLISLYEFQENIKFIEKKEVKNENSSLYEKISD